MNRHSFNWESFGGEYRKEETKSGPQLRVILVDFGSLMGPSPNFVLSILLITRATTKEGCEFMLVTADCL